MRFLRRNIKEVYLIIFIENISHIFSPFLILSIDPGDNIDKHIKKVDYHLV